MRLVQSNRLEILLDELCLLLDAPGSDPLIPEIVAVQHPGMGRWLSQQIALKTGICANVEFPLPATLIWNLLTSTLPGTATDQPFFSRPVLLWSILPLLERISTPEPESGPDCYLNGDQDGSRLYQLSAKLADLFDQYLVYRPDMLLQWEQGKERHWQAGLWRQLCTNHSLHRARMLEQFFQAAEQGKLKTGHLPPRISLFGINTLPPVYLQVIDRLAALTDIHIFHLSPCRQAWDDLTPERRLAEHRQRWHEHGQPDLSPYYEEGHPLLASLGRVGQIFFDRLQQHDVHEIDRYVDPDPSSLLGMIQADILDLRQRSPGQPPAHDTSILFTRCHSPMREVQVLYDYLLDLFQHHESLKPGDILVMAPDINRYSGAIAGVFGAAPKSRAIPWSLADRSPAAELPAVRGFLQLLDLNLGRWSGPEVMSLLDIEPLRHRFAIAEHHLPRMHEILTQAGIRWGLDRQQRHEDGLEPSVTYTWLYGLERLLMGILTGPLDDPVNGVVPCFADSSEWLGGLADLVSRLRRLRPALDQDHPPEEWFGLLMNMVDDFFHSRDEEDDGLALLRRVLGEWIEQCRLAGLQRPLSPAMIRLHLQEALSRPDPGRGFLNGRVLFCNMVPMRALPFTVICLLGMDSDSFPRVDHPPSFDLMAARPRIGDRNRRDDDRYLFLETLLSARSHLFISWVGLDQRDNSDLPPSVVVSELLDVIEAGWPGATERLVRQAPLQPFSPRCFQANHPSYQDLWLVTPDPSQNVPFIPRPLAAPAPDPVDLSDLLRFWSHPVRFFLQQRLGLRLDRERPLLPDSETFILDHLESYQLTHMITLNLLTGKDPRSPLRQLQAAGLAPRGGFGDRLFSRCLSKAESLVQTLTSLRDRPVDPMPFRISAGGVELTGMLDSLDNQGLTSYRPSSLKPRDLMRLWIQHLTLNMVRPRGVDLRSRHVHTDGILVLAPVKDPEQELARLLALYHRGQCEPLPFYPLTSHAWAAARPSQRREKAQAAWLGSYHREGEALDPAHVIALAGRDPLDAGFEELAELYLPIFAAREECHASS